MSGSECGVFWTWLISSEKRALQETATQIEGIVTKKIRAEMLCTAAARP